MRDALAASIAEVEQRLVQLAAFRELLASNLSTCERALAELSGTTCPVIVALGGRIREDCLASLAAPSPRPRAALAPVTTLAGVSAERVGDVAGTVRPALGATLSGGIGCRSVPMT
jgi:hypothetical protein